METADDDFRQALSDYWSASTHAEQHWAYVRMLRAGAEPSYGESFERAEEIMNCKDCPPWNPPYWARGFGMFIRD